jgi:hypothetical protein
MAQSDAGSDPYPGLDIHSYISSPATTLLYPDTNSSIDTVVGDRALSDQAPSTVEYIPVPAEQDLTGFPVPAPMWAHDPEPAEQDLAWFPGPVHAAYAAGWLDLLIAMLLWFTGWF